MHLPRANQFLAFVWGPRNVSHTVVDVARLTSCGAIFELGAGQFAQMAPALRTSRRHHGEDIRSRLYGPGA